LLLPEYKLKLRKRLAVGGALRFHMNLQEAALEDMRRNIDAWWPYVEAGAEAILINVSGCGSTVKEYGHYLKHDIHYAEKAQRIAQITRDVSEVVAEFPVAFFESLQESRVQNIAWHAPCSLQHAQKLRGGVEQLMTRLGVTLSATKDSHLCCGSAGTYSIFQSRLAQQLRDRKLQALGHQQVPVIASANIGCIMHLQSGTSTPVLHWIELLAAQLTEMDDLDAVSSRNKGNA